MDQSKALQELMEAADLVGMLEEFMLANNNRQFSPSAWAGLKINLRNVKQTIVSSHSALASDYIARARARVEAAKAENGSATINGTAPLATAPSAAAAPEIIKENGSLSRTEILKQAIAADRAGIKMERKDLRATLERFIEK